MEKDPERCLNGAEDRCGRGGRAGAPPPAQPAGISAPGARRAEPPSLSRLHKSGYRLPGESANETSRYGIWPRLKELKMVILSARKE